MRLEYRGEKSPRRSSQVRFSPALRNIPYQKIGGRLARGTCYGVPPQRSSTFEAALTASQPAASGLPIHLVGDPDLACEKPRLRQRMVHRQPGEAEEF
jgi:hypothetical protein